MNEDNVKKLWDAEWKENNTIEQSASPIGRWLRRQRLRITSEMMTELDRNLSVIDMGCGGGTTLKLIRRLGFKNSIGIDFSVEALKRCEAMGFKEGVDIFNHDAKATPYRAREFDIGFEEGLWEHFKDPSPYIDEACRISGKWLLIIQPNHYTIFGGLLHWAWEHFKGGGVKEYSFPINYFSNRVEANGFTLRQRRDTMLGIQAILLFKRETR